jgi:tRNA dimethylallyltransferase
MPLVIAGPTAGGKSALAMKMAEEHHGEIICADSRQFYAGMSIATACPGEEDMRIVKHHGYGIIDPACEKIDAGFFVNFAHKTIEKIQKRKKRPILVGGTGLYLRALYYGLQDVPKASEQQRNELALRCDREGLWKLYQELLNIDEDVKTTIKPTDRYRILRALEIYYVTGKKPSVLRKSFKNVKPQLHAHWVYKKPLKEILMEKIRQRVDMMFQAGLIDEAKSLRARLSPGHWALTVMGYEEVFLFLDGKLSLDEAKEKIVIRHRQYAKRQYTWFNKESFYRFIIA